MKNIISFIALFFITQITFAQEVIYKNLRSEKLADSREIKIQLPKSYDSSNKKYPIILVLDGDYMFELASGCVSYYSYWEDIPESIVVGINQIKKREDDISFSMRTSLPTEKSSAFFEFISMELIPYIESNYRTARFKTIIGQGLTANFINYFLLKEEPLFNAYIALSADFAPGMIDFVSEKLSNIETKVFYYFATSKKDIGFIRQDVEKLNTALQNIDNKNVFKIFDNFETPTHYALPTYAIPKALERIFSVFQPISRKEYKETILKLDTSPVDYLVEKYEMIERLITIDKTPIIINDFKAIEAVIKKKEAFEYYEQLGELAKKEHPETLLGDYYLGVFNDKMENNKKAIKYYESAFLLEDIGGINKDKILERTEELKSGLQAIEDEKEKEKADKKEEKKRLKEEKKKKKKKKKNKDQEEDDATIIKTSED